MTVSGGRIAEVTPPGGIVHERVNQLLNLVSGVGAGRLAVVIVVHAVVVELQPREALVRITPVLAHGR